MDKQVIYVRMKRKTSVPVHTKVNVQHIAHLSGTDPALVEQIKATPVYHVTKEDHEYAVIDSLQLIHLLQKKYPSITWEMIGHTESVLHIKQAKKKALSIKFILAWLILFIGTAMTIINFHYDVSMMEVHQRLHYLLTGEETSHPLWIQVPYSFGLGVGMVLFLNHWFKKRFNEEPSPLELELFSYEQQVEQYLAYYENDLNNEDRSL